MSKSVKRPRPRPSHPERPFEERQGVLLTVNEAADYLGVTERQVWKRIYARDLTKIKVGGVVRVHIDDLDSFVERQREAVQ